MKAALELRRRAEGRRQEGPGRERSGSTHAPCKFAWSTNWDHSRTGPGA